MLHCLIPSWFKRRQNPSSSLPSLQGRSAEDTPSSSAQPSPTINLTREYTFAIQTTSYSEIWSRIHPNSPSFEEHLGEGEAIEEHLSLEQILNPSREYVDNAIQHARPTTLTQLVSTYFEHSENTFHLCLILHNSVQRARLTYRSLHNLLDVLPLDSDPDSLNQSQCDWAFDIFREFDCLDNPFPCPESHNFRDMRNCFSQLNNQLQHCLSESRSRVSLGRRATTCSAGCLIGPLLPTVLPSKITKKEMAHMAQLDGVARGTCVLQHDLDTIDRLVERLYIAVEGNKFLIRLGLEKGNDRRTIHEIMKRLQKNHPNFLSQLMDLEEHICLCFAAINRARSLLLEGIHLH